jgi:hypothetical protein
MALQCPSYEGLRIIVCPVGPGGEKGGGLKQIH